MPRLLAIDYGAKRCGLAETDDLQLVAGRLETVPADKLLAFVKQFVAKYKVETVVMGEPKRADGSHPEIWEAILKFRDELKKNCPDVEVEFADERFTSKLAVQTMISAGVPKKKRADKTLVDGVSATLILQQYLEQQRR